METQNYSLEFEDRGDYLYAYLEGEDSFAASLSYWNEIADQVEKLGHRRLLVHENLVGEVSGREIYDLIMDLKDTVLRKTKIAFYDANSADTFLNNLGKLVANFRGGNVHIFHRLDHAQRWIENNA